MVTVDASVLTFFAVLDLALRSATGTRWMSIASTGAMSHIRAENECDNLVGLVRKQKHICRRNVEMMDSVKSGAVVAIRECQQQFSSRRWNCSTVNAVSVFGKIHNSGIREMAFVHAISSAGVAHAVTRACSMGGLQRCGCDKTVGQRTTVGPGATRRGVRGVGGGGGSFQWAGCSDNAAYGSAFAKLFIDARERARGKEASRALMNLHNNNAGRKAIEDYMKVQCKCHGVSGSCEVRTCWRMVPPFHEVGTILKDKYNGATEVEQRLVGGTRRELVPRNDQFKPPSDADLVYLRDSPDFCEPDRRTGSLGTHGRLCNRSSGGVDGCELMCCGRGFNVRRRRVVERCSCKFHWCCYVKCQKCRRVIDEYVCR